VIHRPALAASRLLLPTLAILIVVGCAAGAATTEAPSGVPSPGSTGEVIIRTADDAAARVLTQLGRWPGVGPFDPNRIGQCCGYRVQQTAEGWVVTIEVGWGDCPAGCINRHQWRYLVRPDGTVVVQGEGGPPVPPGLPGAEAVGGSPEASDPAAIGSVAPAGSIGIKGVALAGPTCPVVRPNDPGCADRPVPGAVIHVLGGSGGEVATLRTDATGTFSAELPPGDYRLVADPVAGTMQPPPPVLVTVTGGIEDVQLSYDTGIR
jgi:hypothetical protein